MLASIILTLAIIGGWEVDGAPAELDGSSEANFGGYTGRAL